MNKTNSTVFTKWGSITEIYKSSAVYIDPYKTNYNLSQLIETPVSSATEILNEYSYENAAKKLYNILKGNI